MKRCWSLVPGPWSLVPGPWSQVPGPWSLVPGPWSLVPGPRSLVPASWSLVPGPWSQVPGPRSLNNHSIYEKTMNNHPKYSKELNNHPKIKNKKIKSQKNTKMIKNKAPDHLQIRWLVEISYFFWLRKCKPSPEVDIWIFIDFQRKNCGKNGDSA